VVELLRTLGESGRTVIVSSHVLHEVERMAPRVLVLVNGRLVAEGETAEIRQLISDRPRRVRITTDGDGTSLARDLVGAAAVSAIELAADGFTVDTDDVERFIRVEPVGDDLESVYAYLHDRARGAAR
jgi:ABC-2 type transport system ATP-binding protein